MTTTEELRDALGADDAVAFLEAEASLIDRSANAWEERGAAVGGLRSRARYLREAAAELQRLGDALPGVLSGTHRIVPVEALPLVDDEDLSGLDLTPEGYVREWDKRGRVSPLRVPRWEREYQSRGLIEMAANLGYIDVGRNVGCTITILLKGEEVLAALPHTEEK